jgi:hypothetical protein
VLRTYKLGAIEVEKGDGAKGKELTEAARREKPGLVHVDYNLGCAEMLLGNDPAAADHFERVVQTDTDSEVIEQPGSNWEPPIVAYSMDEAATPWPPTSWSGGHWYRHRQRRARHLAGTEPEQRRFFFGKALCAVRVKGPAAPS